MHTPLRKSKSDASGSMQIATGRSSALEVFANFLSLHAASYDIEMHNHKVHLDVPQKVLNERKKRKLPHLPTLYALKWPVESLYQPFRSVCLVGFSRSFQFRCWKLFYSVQMETTKRFSNFDFMEFQMN